MGLLINEEEIVQSFMEHLMPLLNRVMLCLSICTITYVLREFLKDRRERRLHAEQIKQLQRMGSGKNKAE